MFRISGWHGTHLARSPAPSPWVPEGERLLRRIDIRPQLLPRHLIIGGRFQGKHALDRRFLPLVNRLGPDAEVIS